jgi:16S rRNA (guanine527-N7)-methyltransferase
VVSRETPPVEAEPALAVELFSDRIELAREYVRALGVEGELRGLIGPLEPARLWTRHVLNSALVAPLLRGEVADVGSGAGLPGLVLAIARPDIRVTLIEPMERRVEWLTEQTTALGLDNVTVLRARAEEVDDSLLFDFVTARAVGALTKLIPLTAPLVRSGGELVLLKGQTVDGEIAKARKTISQFRLVDARVEVLGVGMPTEPTRIFRATVE